MDDKDISSLFELLDKTVNEDQLTWKQKKTQILDQARLSSLAEANLSEFLSWFKGTLD
jgi:hypothetical protein